MTTEIVILSAVVGMLTSLITAYITTRLRIKEEEEKWHREFAIKFAELESTDKVHAGRVAQQFAIGVLIKNPKSEDRERIFVPPNCRLVAGREEASSIPTNDRLTARQHCAFYSDERNVYVEELGSANGSLVNGNMLNGKRLLTEGDVVRLSPETEFHFHRLSD